MCMVRCVGVGWCRVGSGVGYVGWGVGLVGVSVGLEDGCEVFVVVSWGCSLGGWSVVVVVGWCVVCGALGGCCRANTRLSERGSPQAALTHTEDARGRRPQAPSNFRSAKTADR